MTARSLLSERNEAPVAYRERSRPPPHGFLLAAKGRAVRGNRQAGRERLAVDESITSGPAAAGAAAHHAATARTVGGVQAGPTPPLAPMQQAMTAPAPAAANATPAAPRPQVLIGA
jgi:hypothetical protein